MSTKGNLKTLLYQALTLYEPEDKLVDLPEGRPIWTSEQEVLTACLVFRARGDLRVSSETRRGLPRYCVYEKKSEDTVVPGPYAL